MNPGLACYGTQIAGLEVEPEETVTSFEAVQKQQGAAVGPPVLDEDTALEIHREVVPLAGLEIPDPGSLVALALVIEGQPLVARHRRPALRHQRHAVVRQLADRSPGARIDDLERRMDQVAVLGVLQAQERAVGRQRSSQESGFVDAAEANGLGRAVDLARSGSVERDIHAESVWLADPRGDDARRLSQTLVPAVRDALEQPCRLSAGERLYEPASRFGAGLVLKPEDALSVERWRAVDHANLVVRDLTTRAGVPVPCVHLPPAGLIGRIHEPLGRERGPLG